MEVKRLRRRRWRHCQEAAEFLGHILVGTHGVTEIIDGALWVRLKQVAAG